MKNFSEIYLNRLLLLLLLIKIGCSPEGIVNEKTNMEIKNQQSNFIKILNNSKGEIIKKGYNMLSLNSANFSNTHNDFYNIPNHTPCKNNCSYNGYCHRGKCLCKPGYYGDDCNMNGHNDSKDCPNKCNKKGTCHKGKCVCEKDYAGNDCSISIYFILFNI